VIEDGFWIGKYELTMRENPRNKNPRIANGKKNHPLTGVHWDDGKNMLIRNLTQAEQEAGRLPADWQYSLPTPEQWEYAARAGGTGEWHFGDAVDALPRYANFSDKAHWDSGDLFGNSAHRTLDDGFAGFAPVGSFAPNAWGLHDVHGNIGEWLINHELRGGSYISPPANTRLAYQVRYSSRDNQVYTGYRVVIQKTPPEKPKP
jgi:formylglycine-generating enzyme required for sulfatase activity